MGLSRLLRYRWRALVRHGELDREMDEEMCFHVDMVAREYEAAGFSPEEAHRRAMLDFGGLERKKEETRDARRVRWLDDLVRDTRYGLRALRRSPVFTTVAVLSLGLGIGANTAVFSLVNAVLLRSLPVPNPQELRLIDWTALNEAVDITLTGSYHAPRGARMAVADAVSYPVFSAVRTRCAGQADVFGFMRLRPVNAQDGGAASMANGVMVTGNFFEGLQVDASRGRVFTMSDPESEAAGWVVISHAWWIGRSGADPNVLGRSVTLNGHPFTVIGVLPQGIRGLSGGDDVDFYVSTAAQPKLAAEWSRSAEDRWWIIMMARLAPGTNEDRFRSTASAAFAAAAGDRLKEAGLLIENGRGGLAGDRERYQTPLLLLLGIVGIVILAACSNLAGLSLARAAAREQELMVRPALGAGRGRLLRQSLTESLLLGLLGGAVGVIVAIPGKDALAGLLLDSPTWREGLHYDPILDGRVLGFTLALALLASLLSGLLPALRSARTGGLPGLQDRGLHARRPRRVARVLIVGQMALSIVLLVGAGLYGRTLVNLVHVDPGFRADHLLLFRVDHGSASIPEERHNSYYDDVTASLERLPGVRGVGLAQFVLLSGVMSGGGFFTLPDHPSPDDERPRAHRLTIGESYFATMGIPIVLGRGFERTDDGASRNVVVVNQAFVHHYLADGSPLGERLHADGADWTIVGVSRDARYTAITDDIPPTVYFSFRQSGISAAFFALRTDGPPLKLVDAARRAVSAVDPAVPLAHVETQRQVRDRRISQERLFAYLCGALAAPALLLCCIGLYGLMAYDVSRRTGEIGIRVALGATHVQISTPIVREAMGLTVLGAVVGVPLAMGAVRVIRSQLYGVGPYDPLALGAGILLLLAVALAAVGLPARRAAAVDPADALRSE